MTKSDKIKQLKSSLKNTKAQLKRREAKIARLEARNSQLEAEAKKEKDKLMEQNLRSITKRYQDISSRNLSSKSLSQSDAQQMQALEILLRFLNLSQIHLWTC